MLGLSTVEGAHVLLLSSSERVRKGNSGSLARLSSSQGLLAAVPHISHSPVAAAEGNLALQRKEYLRLERTHKGH